MEAIKSVQQPSSQILCLPQLKWNLAYKKNAHKQPHYKQSQHNVVE